MDITTLFQPRQVNRRIRELGLLRWQLRYVMGRAAQGYQSVSHHDTPLVPSLLVWAYAVRGLRETLRPAGWTKCDDKLYARIVSPTGRVAIAVANGDRWTGCPYGTPNVRTRKGPCTGQAVALNQDQLRLAFAPKDMPRLLLPQPSTQDCLTWLLLLRAQPGQLAGELSLPAVAGASHRITHWHERIMLPPVRWGAEPQWLGTPRLPANDPSYALPARAA